MSEAVPSIIAQSWPWGSQIAVEKKKKFAKGYISTAALQKVKSNPVYILYIHGVTHNF